jgi:hypothetical protein
MYKGYFIKKLMMLIRMLFVLIIYLMHASAGYCLEDKGIIGGWNFN